MIEDLRYFGRKVGRLVLKEARRQLAADALAETAQMKTLRPNPVAQRELRLFGKYRVLFAPGASAGTDGINQRSRPAAVKALRMPGGARPIVLAMTHLGFAVGGL